MLNQAMKKLPAKTADEYLAAAPKDTRVALMKIRKAIRAAAPKATEGIGYGIAGFKYKGKSLLYFGYWKEHCALYGDFGAYEADLKDYELSKKGTLRFSPDNPVPDRLITKIVKARVAQIDKAG